MCPARSSKLRLGRTPVVLKNAFVTSDAEFEAATTPNMDVNQDAGPAGSRETGEGQRGALYRHLESYDPDPAFMLHWEKAKVNAEDLPKAKRREEARGQEACGEETVSN